VSVDGGSRRGKSVSAGSAARGLIQGLDTKGGLERARAVAVWCEVAGAEVSSHAKGFAMRDTELVVYVDSPAWATELTAMSEHYRIALNAALGKESVGSIRFTVSRAPRDAGGENPAQAGPRVPPAALTDEERTGIARMTEPLHSDRLKQAVIKAAEASLGWRKGIEDESRGVGRNKAAGGSGSGPSNDHETGSKH
jgi:hypothetical protein